MKKGMLMLISVVVLLIVGCSTYRPLTASTQFPADGSKYKILGRVETKKKVDKSGYTLLLKEAKKEYPEADDVVNIVIDSYEKPGFFGKSYRYKMSGIAIDYID